MLSFLLTVFGLLGIVAVLVLIAVSRHDGYDARRHFEGPKKTARKFIESQGFGTPIRQGRWGWKGGEAYLKVFGLWWRVPAAWSLPAFRSYLAMRRLDKVVNDA